MATEAQMAANRANARKSTGPRTVEGKAKAAQNAVKHGLRAEQVVIKGEDPGQFEFYRDAMMGELAPVGVMETALAERTVGLAWRLRRAERIQAEVFDALLAKDARARQLRQMTQSLLPRAMRNEAEDSEAGQMSLGRAVVRDYANDRVLDRLGLYEQRIERSLYKTMAELERLRATRRFDPAEADLESAEKEAAYSQKNPTPRGCDKVEFADYDVRETEITPVPNATAARISSSTGPVDFAKRTQFTPPVRELNVETTAAVGYSGWPEAETTATKPMVDQGGVPCREQDMR